MFLRRTIHVRVPLPYKVEDDMADFLSPTALKVMWRITRGLLDRLQQIRGTNAVASPSQKISHICRSKYQP